MEQRTPLRVRWLVTLEKESLTANGFRGTWTARTGEQPIRTKIEFDTWSSQNSTAISGECLLHLIILIRRRDPPSN